MVVNIFRKKQEEKKEENNDFLHITLKEESSEDKNIEEEYNELAKNDERIADISEKAETFWEVLKEELSRAFLNMKPLAFLYWKIKDIVSFFNKNIPKEFPEYGLTMFCGRQGSGKTVSMTEYLERMRSAYPDVLIYTNYNYQNETEPMNGWRDLLEKRNGIKGVIFAIDEIQNEYDSMSYKDFPESLLSVITMQRKQRIKIVATSQIYSRVVKQLREQCFQVVECYTFCGRWTFTRCFDADEYNLIIDNPNNRDDIKRLFKYNFIQTDKLRQLYDTYSVVESMKEKDFIPRGERARQNLS